MAWYMNLFKFPAMGYGLSSFDSKAPLVMAASATMFDESPGLARLYMLDTQNNIRVWNLTIAPTVISNWTLGNYLQPPSMLCSLNRCYRSVAR